MNKTDFAKAIADRADMSQKDATKFLAAFEETMMEDIFAAEDKVSLKIGTFSGYTKKSAERKARNPKTGETIVVPAKTVKGYPKFKPSKAAKE